MKVTTDIIAAVQGPGWKYGLSRVLIDDQKNGVVFIAGSEYPFAFFTVDSQSTSRGSGTSEDGEIVWRRRGSSCQYKLAKCKVSTETITSWWENALPKAGAAETTASYPEGEPSTDWKVDELKSYADDNGIDLDGASRKADMVEIISPSESTTESTSDLDDLL